MKNNYAIPPCSGTEKTFDHFYHYFKPNIESYVYRLIGSIEHADDIRQDIFLKLWLHWEKVNTWEEQRLKNYVFIMVRNLLINQYRRQVRAGIYKRQAAYRCSDFYIDDSIVVKEGMKVLYGAMGKLPGRQKEVFELRNKDLSIHEIARALNVSAHTVKNSFRMASKKVKAELRKELHIQIEGDGRKKLWSVAA